MFFRIEVRNRNESNIEISLQACDWQRTVLIRCQSHACRRQNLVEKTDAAGLLRQAKTAGPFFPGLRRIAVIVIARFG